MADQVVSWRDDVELDVDGKMLREDWDWGHLVPGQFRFCMVPREPLRKPGYESGDVSSVSSDGMMDHMLHKGAEVAEEVAHLIGEGAHIVGDAVDQAGHAVGVEAGKVGREVADVLFGEDADEMIENVHIKVEEIEREVGYALEAAGHAAHDVQKLGSKALHAGEDLALKVGGEALHQVEDAGAKALHVVDDAAHLAAQEALKGAGKVGAAGFGMGADAIRLARGALGVGEERKDEEDVDAKLARAKHQAGMDRSEHAMKTGINDNDSISTKATLDAGVEEAKADAPPEEERPKSRSMFSRFSFGSRPSSRGAPEEKNEEVLHEVREDETTFTRDDGFTLDETTLNTADQDERYRERKRAKKAIKQAREDARDPTPLWARVTNWRLMLKGPLKEPLALPSKNSANEKIIYPKPIEAFERQRTLIERVVSFLNPRSIGRAVRLGRRWAEVGYDEPLYYCLVQVGRPSVEIDAFDQRIDAVVHCGEAILASGDKGVSAFHVDTGEFLGKTAIRDTTAIPILFVTGHSLWTCSKNGAIREWSMPHDVRNIEFRAQMWEHNAEVNDLTWTKSNPLFGGATTEVPRLVSCSDDRSVRIWDAHHHHSTATLNPFSHRSATMRSVYVSMDHLYIGASDGTVFIYSVDGSTRSLRNREKKRVGTEVLYPLETELKCGSDVVEAMVIAGEKTDLARLFVASWAGIVYVWSVPAEDLEYVLLHEIAHHTRRINAVLVSRAHFLTCSDDETIRYYGLCHGDQYELALERVVDCGSRVKCLHLTPGDPGVVVAGLADGRVLVYELGAIM